MFHLKDDSPEKPSPVKFNPITKPVVNLANNNNTQKAKPMSLKPAAKASGGWDTWDDTQDW